MKRWLWIFASVFVVAVAGMFIGFYRSPNSWFYVWGFIAILSYLLIMGVAIWKG